MHNLNIKTFNQKKGISTPHFYLLNKGLNSGKPLLKPCPNCFVCTFDTEETKTSFYWICYSLWKSNSYYPNLKGSVIPFITIAETKKLILKTAFRVTSRNEIFLKSIDALNLIEINEANLIDSVKKVQELKKAFIKRIIC